VGAEAEGAAETEAPAPKRRTTRKKAAPEGVVGAESAETAETAGE